MNETQTVPRTAVWPVLRYRDPDAAIRFLVEAFGFREVAVYRSDDGAQVVHAELSWPLGGRIMLGPAGDESSGFGTEPGNGGIYVLTDDPDALHGRAVAAGARITRGPEDQDYGAREFTAQDPEGVFWSFGTYAGADGES